MPLEPASDTQKRIYDFIVNYIRNEGMPPTNREIGQAMKIASTGHVDYHLSMLEKKGYITREPKKSRGVQLVQQPWGVPVMGSITVGEPLEVVTGAEQLLDVGRNLEHQNAYALVVKGHAMAEDHICDGDYVIIKPQTACQNGDIVVVVHLSQGSSDRVMLRRFLQEQDKVRLQAANSKLDPIYVSRSEWDQEWHVRGKVVALFRQPVFSENEKVSAVLDALEVGATGIDTEVRCSRQETEQKAYERLTKLIKDLLADKPGREAIIDSFRKQPETWREILKNELVEVGADQNREILKTAQEVNTYVIQKNMVYERVVVADNTVQEQLNQIYDQCRNEAKQWFRYSLCAALLGFIIIISGVILAMLTVNSSLGFLTFLASTVPDVAAILFFQQAKEANKRIDYLYTKQVDVASIYRATQLALTTNEEVQDRYLGKIINRWLGLHEH